MSTVLEAAILVFVASPTPACIARACSSSLLFLACVHCAILSLSPLWRLSLHADAAPHVGRSRPW